MPFISALAKPPLKLGMDEQSHCTVYMDVITHSYPDITVWLSDLS